jgi:hypothetical protein
LDRSKECANKVNKCRVTKHIGCYAGEAEEQTYRNGILNNIVEQQAGNEIIFPACINILSIV